MLCNFVFSHGRFGEPSSPRAASALEEPRPLLDMERAVEEWITSYTQQKNHVMQEVARMRELQNEIALEKAPEKYRWMETLKDYLRRHQETLEGGLAQRAKDILERLQEIAKKRGGVEQLSDHLRQQLPVFESETRLFRPSGFSVEAHRMSEESGWANVVMQHAEWRREIRSSTRMDIGMDPLFAEAASLAGVVEDAYSAHDGMLDRAQKRYQQRKNDRMQEPRSRKAA